MVSGIPCSLASSLGLQYLKPWLRKAPHRWSVAGHGRSCHLASDAREALDPGSTVGAAVWAQGLGVRDGEAQPPAL
eukprot:12216460-Alexandrium_andersonii.AAC.1